MANGSMKSLQARLDSSCELVSQTIVQNTHDRYPALHLYVFTAFHRFLPAEDRVRPAQYIYLGLYLTTFLLVSGIYYIAGRPVRDKTRDDDSRTRHIPQALLIPLVLSKRVHSIYLLRLFNDPITMCLFYSSVLVFMQRSLRTWRIGSVLYRWGKVGGC